MGPAQNEEAVDRNPPDPTAVVTKDKETRLKLDVAVVKHVNGQRHLMSPFSSDGIGQPLYPVDPRGRIPEYRVAFMFVEMRGPGPEGFDELRKARPDLLDREI